MGLFSKKVVSKKSAPPLKKPKPKTLSSEEKMKEVSRVIRQADNLNELLIQTSVKAKEVMHADRITIYVVDAVNNLLCSRIMDGSEVKSILVPITNASIAGYVGKNSKIVNIKDAYSTEELQQKYPDLIFDRTWDQKTGYRTKEVLGIPVVLKGKTQGVVQAINKKDVPDGEGFSSADLQFIQDMADNLGPDMYKIKSFEESQQEVEFQKNIKRVTDRIYSAPHVEDALLKIIRDLERIFEVDGVTVYILDKASNELVGRYRVKEEVGEVRVMLNNNSLAGFAATNNKMLNIADAYNESELIKISPDLRFDKQWDQKFNKKTKSVIVFPLIFEGAVNGALALMNKKSGLPFSDKDAEGVREIATTLGIAMSKQKKSVGKRSKYDAIVSANLITQKDLEAALKKAADAGETVETILMDEYNIPLAEIGKCYAYYFRTDYVGFDKEMPIPVDLIHDFTLEKLKSEQWVPLDKKENSVEVAMEDPRDIVKRDNIQLQFKSSTVKFSVTTRDDLTKIVDHFYGISDSVDQAPEDVDDILDELKSEMGEVSEKEKMREELSEDDSAIVRLVNQIIEQAYARQASDIHIEPYAEKDTIVRFRVDGQCSQVMKVPRHYKNALSSRIKIMSNLDIAEKRMPQDGKIKFKHFGRLDIELRVAVIPTVGGNEDIVLRILSSSKAIPLDKLGMSEENLSGFKEILAKPYGICLVVGPTGSGKTTTLHSALGYINTPERKIWTVEDPVEITQYQLRQVQMLPKIGLTFSRAMRAFLRGDPDVIMVGEMRDLETTSTGLEASLTGHLVFSTLHTNNAPETVTRLIDMKIDPFSFADALLGILAQRLLRTLCKSCKEEYHPSKKEFEQLRSDYDDNDLFDSKFKYSNELTMCRPKEKGCKKCNNRGYRGRMGIHELITATDPIK